MNTNDEALAFDRCLLCESTGLAPLRRYEKHYLVKCKKCAFVFCQRKPTAKELDDHYSLYPRANSISSITIKRYHALLDTFERYRLTNNIIDVGCGDGHFLAVAKSRGWCVFGTEFSDEAIKVCTQKGIQMMKSPLTNAHYPADFFDVIASFEVIEHINNPNIELSIFHKMLRKGGIVYVTTPNFNSISRDILGAEWNIIEYPEHLSYYTKRTLAKAFKRHNFKLLNMSTTGISFDRLKSSSGKQDVSVNKTADETLRLATEKQGVFRLLKNAINFVLDISGKGDAMKATFLKRSG